jgi:hypothetical protein
LVKRRRKPFSLPELPDLVEYQEEVFEEEEEEDVQKEVFHEYEPEPYSDPAAKKKMTKIVAEIDSRWNKMEPILDDGRMKIWHVHNGGSIHRYASISVDLHAVENNCSNFPWGYAYSSNTSFKYQVDMPIKPEACVALAKEVRPMLWMYYSFF